MTVVVVVLLLLPIDRRLLRTNQHDGIKRMNERMNGVALDWNGMKNRFLNSGGNPILVVVVLSRSLD